MANHNPIYPAWCPCCGTPQGASYPFPIGENIIGCKECMSTWPVYALAAMVRSADPRIQQREVV